MKSFIIRRLKESIELDRPLEKLDGFKYVPQFRTNELKVKEIIIVSPNLTDKLIEISFDKKYKKVLEMYLKVLEDGENAGTNTNLMLALDEITRLRNIIIKKYQKALSKKTLELLLKKLKILENEIRIKVIDYKMMLEQKKVPEIERGKGR